jgi:hypothetical protein
MKISFLLFIAFFNYTLVHSQNFKILSQLEINDNLSFSTLKYNRDEYGVSIMNNKGVMTKEQAINSIPIDLGIMGDNVIVIGAEQKKLKTIGYMAMIINKKSCSILKEGSIFKKEGSNRISSTLLNDPNNNFCYILFRNTNYEEGFAFLGPSIYDTKFLESSSIKLISLNDKLEPNYINIKTVAANSYFAGAVADETKNIYICSFTNDLITVEKFDSTGFFLKKLSTPFSVNDKNPFFNCVIKNEKDNQQSVIITTTCNNTNKKKVLNTIKFDFSINKIIASGEIILNKDYRQTLKNVNEEAKGKNFADIENLEPVQILADSKRVVVVKEIKSYSFGGKGEATTYFREGSIISIYNKINFEIEREIVIDKKFATFLESSEGISVHLLGDYLWAITCENSGLASYKTYSLKINLSTGEVNKVEIEKEEIGKGWVTYPMQTAWFKKNFVVPFFKVSSPFSLSFESNFITSPY